MNLLEILKRLVFSFMKKLKGTKTMELQLGISGLEFLQLN